MAGKIICLAVLLVLPFSISVQAQGNNLFQFVESDPCFTEITIDLDVDCGYVSVPEFYDGRTDNIIKLPVLRINSTGQGEGGSPVFFLEGGPGGSILIGIKNATSAIIGEQALAEGDPTPYLDMLQEHDMVYIGQRGTQFAEPFLYCEELETILGRIIRENLDISEWGQLHAGITQECVDEFTAAGVDLNAYNSNANADDVNSIRQALGYERIIYYGESYGTHLGQFVMRRHQEILEAVILDGAQSVSKVAWSQNWGPAAEKVIDDILAYCNADESCSELVGETSGLLEAAFERLQKNPVIFSYAGEDSTVSGEGTITADLFAGYITTIATNFYLRGTVPYMLLDLVDGDGEAIGAGFAQIMAAEQPAVPDPNAILFANVMHLAMVCSDDPDVNVNDYDRTGYSPFAEAVTDGFAIPFRSQCPVLNVERLSAESDELVTLNVPTLLLGGGLDNRTPLSMNQEVADALHNARLVVFPYGAHVQYSPPRGSCPTSIISQFVQDPSSLDSLDTACATNFTPLAFPSREDLGLGT